MIGRFNVFWLGAGGFLVVFCLNEIIAYHLAAVPLWLGGPLSYVGMVVGVIVGLSVAAFLGIEAPRAEQGAGEPGASGVEPTSGLTDAHADQEPASAEATLDTPSNPGA